MKRREQSCAGTDVPATRSGGEQQRWIYCSCKVQSQFIYILDRQPSKPLLALFFMRFQSIIFSRRTGQRNPCVSHARYPLRYIADVEATATFKLSFLPGILLKKCETDMDD